MSVRSVSVTYDDKMQLCKLKLMQVELSRASCSLLSRTDQVFDSSTRNRTGFRYCLRPRDW